MSKRVRDLLMGELETLRHEPTDKRIRARFDDETVVDSTRALLVWEPRRIVPSYAVPIDDIDGALRPAGTAPVDAAYAGRPVHDPSVPFSVHTAAGEAVVVRAGATGREAAGFRPSDPDLAGYVVLDFGAFDAWYEEDERNVGHPRDPFHRIDIVHSSRHVQVRLDGRVLADSTSPYLLFEPPLPVRYYLPANDVATDLLTPSDTSTFCAYKGRASYWSAPGHQDVVWAYPAPLREAAEVTGRFAFFNEHVDIVVDGTTLERPMTFWSR
jgi:uncharacterized protein (DUF427 family)